MSEHLLGHANFVNQPEAIAFAAAVMAVQQNVDGQTGSFISEQMALDIHDPVRTARGVHQQDVHLHDDDGSRVFRMIREHKWFGLKKRLRVLGAVIMRAETEDDGYTAYTADTLSSDGVALYTDTINGTAWQRIGEARDQIPRTELEAAESAPIAQRIRDIIDPGWQRQNGYEASNTDQPGDWEITVVAAQSLAAGKRLRTVDIHLNRRPDAQDATSLPDDLIVNFQLHDVNAPVHDPRVEQSTKDPRPETMQLGTHWEKNRHYEHLNPLFLNGAQRAELLRVLQTMNPETIQPHPLDARFALSSEFYTEFERLSQLLLERETQPKHAHTPEGTTTAKTYYVDTLTGRATLQLSTQPGQRGIAVDFNRIIRDANDPKKYYHHLASCEVGDGELLGVSSTTTLNWQESRSWYQAPMIYEILDHMRKLAEKSTAPTLKAPGALPY